MKKQVLVQSEKHQFALLDEPTMAVLTIHMQNLVITYGTETVAQYIATFRPEMVKQIRKHGKKAA